jgi:uncharacterized protein DUF4129
MSYRSLCVFAMICGEWSGAVCGPAHCAELPGNRAAQFSAGSAGEKIYDVGSFDRELARFGNALQDKSTASQIAEINKSLPSSWTIRTPERTYTISTRPFKAQLNPGSARNAVAWLAHLREEVKSSQTSGAPNSAARSDLDKILAEPEFGAVRAPGALEIFRQRFWAWVERMLQKFFGGMARHPIGAEILFWALLAGSVPFVALLAFRFLAPRDTTGQWKAEPSVVAERTWQEWVRSARHAANRGDFREAVHSAYWAGIARLEDLGALPRDRARTPREYLRLVSESKSGEANAPRRGKEPLSILTTRLERSWYAGRGASAEDFQDSLRQLEALGCLLE